MNAVVAKKQSRRVAIIGAGASGICAAKYLLAEGLDVDVYEIGTKIGGLWVYENDNGRSSAYKSLHINSEKRNTQFHDFPFPADIQYFPDHVDMAKYLKNYADNFGVTPRIKFKSEVIAVEPIPAGEGIVWQVSTKNGSVEVYDSVVAATGHLTVPSNPGWKDQFTGNYLHSHYYRVPEPFSKQKVLVVGVGNSACDIAADLCMFAERTVMSVRSPELIVPKIFLGVPVTQITGKLDRWWLPANAPRWARSIITRLVHGRMEDWGITTPKGPTHPISHATLINHIAYRRVHVKPGITSVNGKRVRFTDGSEEEFDTIIGATGYLLEYGFVSDAFLPVDEGRADLYKRIVPIEWPGLYFIGLFNTLGSSNLRMFEVQSRFIAAVETGRALLPSKAAMRKDIDELNAYIAKKFPPGPRHAIEIEPNPYTRGMNKEEKLGQERRRMHQRPDGSLPEALFMNRSVEVRVNMSAVAAMAPKPGDLPAGKEKSAAKVEALILQGNQ